MTSTLKIPVGMSADEVMELLELDRKLKEAQASEAIEEISPTKQRLIRITSSGQLDKRQLANVKTGAARRKKNHKKRVKRANNQRFWHKRRVRNMELANEGMWYKPVLENWVKQGLTIEIHQDEWEAEVDWAVPEGRVISVSLYDTGQPVRMDNIIVRDALNGAVYFDGKEFLLKKLGYAL